MRVCLKIHIYSATSFEAKIFSAQTTRCFMSLRKLNMSSLFALIHSVLAEKIEISLLSPSFDTLLVR